MNSMIDLILTSIYKNEKRRRSKWLTKANIHNFLFFSLPIVCVCIFIRFKCVLLTHAFTFVRSIERSKLPFFFFLSTLFACSHVQSTSNLTRNEDTCMNEYMYTYTSSYFHHFSLRYIG